MNRSMPIQVPVASHRTKGRVTEVKKQEEFLTGVAISSADAAADEDVELSVLILTRNEEENISQHVPSIWKVVNDMGVKAEIVLIDASSDQTAAIGEKLGCRVIRQKERGYGPAFHQGLSAVRGNYVITVDADHSHEP